MTLHTSHNNSKSSERNFLTSFIILIGLLALLSSNLFAAKNLIYASNGSDNGSAPATQSYNNNNTVTVAGNTGNLVKAGFIFDGWNTAADGSGTTYQPNQTFTFGTTEITLYANWRANTAPTFTSTATTTAAANFTYSYTVSTSDAEGDAVTITGTTVPSWLSFDGTTLSGTPAVSDVGDHSVTLTATDGVDSTQQTFTITVSATANFTISNEVDFSVVYTANSYSKTLVIGNTNLCRIGGAYIAGGDGNGVNACDPNGAGSGTSNNDVNMINNDFDDTLGINGHSETTTNSSSAYLAMTGGSEVLWAGLYWQSHVSDNSGTITTTDVTNASTIKFKHNNENSYTTLTAEKVNWSTLGGRFYFQGYAEVTSQVNTNKTGHYWVGDITAMEGRPTGGSFGGWSLVVVYKDVNEPIKNTTIYYGYKQLGGGGPGTITSTLTGFLTPSATPIDSTLFVMTGEGDTWGSDETASITDKSGTPHTLSNGLNPNGNIFNATITDDGSTVTTGQPYYSTNSLGIDIDSYDLSNIIDTEQSSTDITFTGGGDGVFLGMYAIESQLRSPNLCYDYAYSQYGQFLTEDYNQTTGPQITGNFTQNEPIQVRLYVKNTEDSDILVEGMKINILDINTSQASYIVNSTEVTYPNTFGKTAISDASLDVAADNSYVKEIPIGDLDSLEYFYTYYQLNPTTSSIEMPINARVDYNITLPAGSVDITIPYELYLDSQIPICTANSTYTPGKAIFNIVHDAYYNASLSSDYYYNLPTQVTKRPGNFKVLAMDPDNLDDLTNISTVIMVELIDASAFHDTNASCTEPDSSISEKIIVKFDNNVSTINFDKDVIDTSLANEAPANVNITNAEDFYSIARKNAAFRISYFTEGDNNDSILQTADAGNGKTQIVNFSELVSNIHSCAQPVMYPSGSSGNFAGPSDNISNACGNAGNTGVSDDYLQSCIRCLFGYNTKVVCSRDNFAIRPEAFLMQLDDQNQTNKSSQVPLSPPSAGGVLDLASGYDYNLEVNATNHVDTTASQGYSQSLSSDTKFIWEPRSAVTNCNDDTNKTITVTFSNGVASTDDTNVSEVGDYRLNLLDTTWTGVDNDPSSIAMTHHTGTYFTNTADCLQNDSTTQLVTSSSLNGCNISSAHANPDTGYTTYDYNVTLHPYKFDMSGIIPGVGLTNTTPIADSFIYMADISFNNGQDQNMSYHLRGPISAEGYNDTVLRNFVNGCYAKDISLTINKTAISGAVAHQYMFTNTDGMGRVDTTATDINNTTGTINLTATDFNQTNNGVVNTNVNINFDRNQTIFMNPERVTFSTYTSNCTTSANCTMNADLSSSYTTDGNITLDNNVTHYFGKSHAGRKRYEIGTDGPPYPANIYFEVFCFGTVNGNTCNPNLLQNPTNLQRTDDLRWYINPAHDATRDGLVQGVSQTGGLSVVTGTTPSTASSNPAVTNLTYNGGTDPYKTTMDMNSSRWLIYNKYDATTNVNQFPVEFEPAAVGWSGEHETNTTKTDNATIKTNRRSMW